EVSLADFRKDVILDGFNEAGQKVSSYQLFRCWVSEFQSVSDLDANANAVAIQHIKLENEGWERDYDVTEPSSTSRRTRRARHLLAASRAHHEQDGHRCPGQGRVAGWRAGGRPRRGPRYAGHGHQELPAHRRVLRPVKPAVSAYSRKMRGTAGKGSVTAKWRCANQGVFVWDGIKAVK